MALTRRRVGARFPPIPPNALRASKQTSKQARESERVNDDETCLLQKGGVSTWFPTYSGEEYNKHKSMWQEAVQSEKPREADSGSPLNMGDLLKFVPPANFGP